MTVEEEREEEKLLFLAKVEGYRSFGRKGKEGLDALLGK